MPFHNLGVLISTINTNLLVYTAIISLASLQPSLFTWFRDQKAFCFPIIEEESYPLPKKILLSQLELLLEFIN